MVTADDSGLDDDALFREIVAARAQASGPADALRWQRQLAILLGRWRRPAHFVVRRVQASYRRDNEADREELVQDAICKLLDRGLDQFRGRASEASPGEAEAATSEAVGDGGDAAAGEVRTASARTFFLRIVKHAAIDHYRKHREELASPNADGDEPEASAPELEVSMGRARRDRERDDALELYWRAFARLGTEHPREAEAWDLYHHRDLGDHEACARALGITVVNSYKRVSRAQAHLRLFLLELRDELDRT